MQNLEHVIEGLRVSRETTHNIRREGSIRSFPSRDALESVVENLSTILFPTHLGHPDSITGNVDEFVGALLSRTLPVLEQQISRDLAFSDGSQDVTANTQRIVGAFAGQLPGIRGLLVEDLRAAYRGDPAATNLQDILLGYPGMAAIISYRLAHGLYQLGARLSARLIGHIAHSKTAIDIHPAAEIGQSFFIDHGTGVVIGETAIIGNRVRLYQAVTLGAKSFHEGVNGDLVKGQPRHPVLEDDVVIYAGATILGRIIIGRGSIIGGNVWLTQSVAPGSVITQARAIDV